MVIPTSGDFQEATRALRETATFGTNTFAAINDFATSDKDTITVKDASGVSHTINTVTKMQKQVDEVVASMDGLHEEKEALLDQLHAEQTAEFTEQQAGFQSEHTASQAARDTAFEERLADYDANVAALTNGIMSKAEFEALREQRRRQYDNNTGSLNQASITPAAVRLP